MKIFNRTQNKSTPRLFLISTVLAISLMIVPLPAFAKDADSVDTLRQMGRAFAKIAEKASPAVVGIKVEKKTADEEYSRINPSPYGSPFDPFEDDFFDYFFRRQLPRKSLPQQPRYYHQLAEGSGFIISPDGYILTNNHLVGNADKVIVVLKESKEVPAKVIGTDPDSDVAVVKIDSANLPCLEIADSDKLEVGEWVLAIGNPFGLSHTVTAGIVSAKGRTGVGIATYEDFIQTDAAINRGNSGGPLLNLDGKVVGINTAIVSSTGSNMGIGFAIPINMAKSVYDQLVSKGTVTRGFLGISIQDLTLELAASFKLKDAKGVLLADVTKDSAADKAGLKQGDIVVEFDGQPVDKAKILQSRVAMLEPGTKAKIIVLRNGEQKTFTVEIGKRQPQQQLAAAQSSTLEQFGITVQNLTDKLAEQLGYDGLSGVVVAEVEPGSLAELAGIGPEMLITEVNRKPVKNTKDFKQTVDEAVKEGTILLLVRDENSTRFVVLTLPKK